VGKNPLLSAESASVVTVNVPPMAVARRSCRHVVEKLPEHPPTWHWFVDWVSVHDLAPGLGCSAGVEETGVFTLLQTARNWV